MANQMSDYLEGKLIEHVLRNVSYTSPATVYLGLFTAAPGEAGGGTEVTTSGTAYVRQAITFGAHSGGTCTNSAEIVFAVATANYGNVTDFAIFDASSAGNELIYGTWTNSTTINTGNQYRVAVGQLSVQFL